ncbi:ABC transporter substrate-binding protein [Shewanella surugensis]|uniref:ABC transporter substrate-binding protein n=1 Tax=Shewanella surugensis TaxID=212020 RepID=A0ABT0LDS0_9GAMM|nr:ABC transporter substrate-binding protein [Shewanella surugensis]MCL1125470.1 ABC transporter substrate-binding protein [Shewanella surugensis]
MRHSLFLSILFLFSSLIGIGTPTLAEESSLTVVSFGGAYGAAQKKHMIDPYMKKTNTTILFDDYSGGVAEMKAQVEANNVLWDVVDIEAIDLERACSEGLLEVIPDSILSKGSDGVSAKKDFLPQALANECGIGLMVWANIFAFSEKTIGKTYPTTIADVFDTKKIPGKRAFRKRPQVNLEWALLADGVPKEKLYATLATAKGQQRAFAKLDTIKKDIVWFDSWSQAPQLLNDGGAVIVQSANGRIYDAIAKDKKPFQIVWDGNLYDLDVWAIVKGTQHKQAALDFITFATGSKPLAGMADIAYGPTRKSSMAYVSPNVLPFLPSSNMAQGSQADSLFWSDYGESLGEKFNEWLLKQ